MFFDFTCAFCATYHDPISQWALTVPKKVSVRMIPVINVHEAARKEEQALAAIAYYAAFRIATRDQLRQFVASVYDSHHEGMPLAKRQIWERAARVARLNLKDYFGGFKSDFAEQSARFSGFKTMQYRLVATPSISVGGRYVLVPDDVGGDQKMFFNILNGLTSEVLNAA
jgi:thiol:disulfide interchange protein DsbA